MSGVALMRFGSSVPDSTPDAVNWADISYTSPGPGSNSNQTVAGINQTITVYWTDSSGFAAAGGTIKYSKNNGADTTLAAETGFSVVATDTIKWTGLNGAGNAPFTITVKYGTVGLGTTWDTFDVTVTP